jgi:hypothetical protein
MERFAAVSSLDEIFELLRRSPFRRRFRLGAAERLYIEQRGLRTVLVQAEELIAKRLAPANPPKDGKQTPFRGHPVFLAQHATATCCRGCLEKWHGIQRGVDLTDEEHAHVIASIERWLRAQLTPAPDETRTSRSRA